MDKFTGEKKEKFSFNGLLFNRYIAPFSIRGSLSLQL